MAGILNLNRRRLYKAIIPKLFQQQYMNAFIYASKDGCLHGIYHCKVQDMLNHFLTNQHNEHDVAYFYDAFDVIFFQTLQTIVERCLL